MVQKILIIEDEISLRTALKDKFTREGFDVLEASDGVAAVEVAKQNKPDLILLDIIMPKQNGLDVLKAMKTNLALVSVPVFVLTNLSEESNKQETKKLGVEEYLIKSDYSLEEIVSMVKKRLNPINLNRRVEQ